MRRGRREGKKGETEVTAEVDPAEDAARRAADAAREHADVTDDVAADHDVEANAPNEALGAQGGTRAYAARVESGRDDSIARRMAQHFTRSDGVLSSRGPMCRSGTA